MLGAEARTARRNARAARRALRAAARSARAGAPAGSAAGPDAQAGRRPPSPEAVAPARGRRAAPGTEAAAPAGRVAGDEAEGLAPPGGGAAGGPAGLAAGLEGRSLGDPGRGRALLAGRGRLEGHALPAPPADPWATVPAAALHGFAWLEDLAALGGAAARAAAQGWLAVWLERFGAARGRGAAAAWRPDLAGRRLIRWSHHARFLLAGPGRRQAQALALCARAHGPFLAERWSAAAPGLPQIEALTGLVHAACATAAPPGLAAAARAGLERGLPALIDARGGVPSRCPEELLAVFTHLSWADAALQAAGQTPPPALTAALERMAPSLKALRHADGGLARFHGGGAGAEGALDLALAEAGARARPRPGGAMGFVRLAARRTTVIVDAAAPPPTPAGQAATLGFELTSGRRPVIAGPGPGAAFGGQWARAVRASAAHATLTLEGWSSSRLAPAARAGTGPEPALADRPAQVTLTREGEGPGAALVLSHDGWARSHGLVHVRRLALSGDGRALWGEDALIALTPAQRRRVEALLGADPAAGIGFALRFPLHPEVRATLQSGGRAVRLALRSGEVWLLQAEGALAHLEPAVHFDPARDAPRQTLAVVLPGRARGPAQQIGWTLAKAEDTPTAVRDLALAEEAAG